jgi:acyl CoA:acetate/3-ketoacid CoA transferase alpha subunit
VSKLREDARVVLADVVSDNSTVAVGGFGLCGDPFDLIEALRDIGAITPATYSVSPAALTSETMVTP